MLNVFNTLSRKKEAFRPLHDKKVGLYTCGPTVYWFAHIGNLRTYIFEDILKRVLEYNGYKVKHVMNITDVGHLTSDADTGEDKLEKGAKREKKSVWEIAEFYTNILKEDLNNLNIKSPNVWIKATDTIKEQIALIKILEKKEFTYQIEDGVYFDTSKLKTYGRLWPKNAGKEIKHRVEMVPGKKNPTDFALWKFSPKNVKRQMEWQSPWGVGFPGWHTECVVMSIKELGIPFDIHCGGIDHILIHHTNEIAQAEAAYGKIMARYWLHGEFLNLKEDKMAKSKGNIVTLKNLKEKNIDPLAYRYLCLNAHYRSKLAFSWEALKAAQNSLDNLYEKFREFQSDTNIVKTQTKGKNKIKSYKKQFLNFINDDLNMPKGLALTWKLVKDKTISPKAKSQLLLDFDKVFGLRLDQVKPAIVPKKVKDLAQLREQYRKEKQWQKADEIRKKIQELGYQVEDSKEGPIVRTR